MNCTIARVNILVGEVVNGGGRGMWGLAGKRAERRHWNVACFVVDQICELVVGRKIVPAGSRPTSERLGIQLNLWQEFLLKVVVCAI